MSTGIFSYYVIVIDDPLGSADSGYGLFPRVHRAFASVAAFVITANFWKSFFIAIVAIGVPLLPFFWRVFREYVDPENAQLSSLRLFALCMDEWLVGSLSVGVAAVINWLESNIDFRLSSFSTFFTSLAGIGSFIFLAMYVVVHNVADDLAARGDEFVRLLTTIYYSGIAIVFTSFISIAECRRAKDVAPRRRHRPRAT